MKPIVYISGPIRDSDFLKAIANLHRFFAAEIELTTAGYSVINPASDVVAAIMHGKWLDHRLFLGKDEAFVKRSDAMLQLPHWRGSGGALQEYAWAQEVGIPCCGSIAEVKRRVLVTL